MLSVEKKPSKLKVSSASRNRRLSCLFLASAVGVVGVSGEACASEVLKKGAKGSEVFKLQEHLQRLGYLKDSITGVFNTETERAVIQFQQAKGLAADGIVGLQTKSVLFGGQGKGLNIANIGSPRSKLPQSSGPLPVPAPPPIGNVSNNAVVQYPPDNVTAQNTVVTVKPVNQTQVIALTTTKTPTNPILSVANNRKSYLYSSQKFHRGDRHQGVVLLQQELQKRGFYRDKVDGVYGSSTEIAVKAFQRANNLSSDGVVGMQTLAYFAR